MTTPQPSGSTSPATRRSSRLGARRGVLGVVAAAAVASCLLALSALSSGSTAAPAPSAAAPQVSLAAVQAGAADALNSLNAAPAAAGTVRIAIQNYAFAPATVTITPGTTVVWTNEDSVPHNVHVTSGPATATSPMLQKGDSYTYTFTKSGAYSYVCDYHPDMKASLTVSGSTTTTVPPTTTTAPTTTGGTTTTMPMSTTTTSGGSGTCLVSGILTPLITHINATHLGESPGQQVQDLLNLDQYVKTHTALIASMLNPLTNGGLVNLLNGTLTPLIVHLNATHLGESPGQQVQDLLNTDQYIKTHTALISNMLLPLEGATC